MAFGEFGEKKKYRMSGAVRKVILSTFATLSINSAKNLDYNDEMRSFTSLRMTIFFYIRGFRTAPE